MTDPCIRLGMVGGGQGAFIGAVHRIAARIDGEYELVAGALSIYITFQLFGFLPDSQRSLHRYTDMESVPSEGMMAPPSEEY